MFTFCVYRKDQHKHGINVKVNVENKENKIFACLFLACLDI
jgi:hypothetical protein